ncbi:UNVERIFIED_CONTAM: hypothetical protein FKN15_062073 [Acipenser sinensis]
MSQFMDVMMGQQSLLMSLTNMAPQATDAQVGPTANQPVFPPQPLATPVVQQPQGVWDISRDASEGEPLLEEGSVEAELTFQHSEQDTELEVLDTNDPLWSLVERATRPPGIEWPAVELPRQSLFELTSVRSPQPRMLPAFPDFIKKPWLEHRRSRVKLKTLQVLTDSAGPWRLIKKGYSAATEAVRLSNVASFLSVYQASLVKDLPEHLLVSLRAELALVTQLQVKIAQLNALAQGRSIASLVVARRQLWLSQVRVQEPDKAPLLDAPITPGHTFGPTVEEMLKRSAKAWEASQQMAKMWPHKPFQSKEPGLHPQPIVITREQYIATEYPEKATKEKRGIRKTASTFTLKGKYLYVPEKNGECLHTVVTDEEEKTAILNEVHAGHFNSWMDLFLLSQAVREPPSQRYISVMWRPYRIGLELMVECGRCGEWFHGQCQDLQPDDLISMEEYMCSICRVTHMEWQCNNPLNSSGELKFSGLSPIHKQIALLQPGVWQQMSASYRIPGGKRPTL